MATRKSTAQAASNQNPVPNAYPGVVQFEPCSSPRSNGRGLHGDKSEPTYTLKRGNRVFVFGAEDCRDFGDGTVTRLNAFARYGSEDYLDLLKVQWLHLFNEWRGKGVTIAPSGVVSVPISIYNDVERVAALKKLIVGLHEIEDAQGCKLTIRIDTQKLLIIPESVGAFFHAAQAGVEANLDGNILVVDIGALTTDMSLFSARRYQPNHAATAPSIGMGKIAGAIQSAIRAGGQEVDISEIDAGLRLLSNVEPGAAKTIMINKAYRYDVTALYDAGVADLTRAARDFILNTYRGLYNDILLTGGGAYHLFAGLKDLVPGHVAFCPDPTVANVLGGFGWLRAQAEAANADALLFCLDNGNGASKGISNRTARR